MTVGGVWRKTETETVTVDSILGRQRGQQLKQQDGLDAGGSYVPNLPSTALESPAFVM